MDRPDHKVCWVTDTRAMMDLRTMTDLSTMTDAYPCAQQLNPTPAKIVADRLANGQRPLGWRSMSR